VIGDHVVAKSERDLAIAVAAPAATADTAAPFELG